MVTKTDIRAMIEEARPRDDRAIVHATKQDIGRVLDIQAALLEHVEALEAES